jgi:uncharacterized protein YdhG (YjbR/CyaY superfamily)
VAGKQFLTISRAMLKARRSSLPTFATVSDYLSALEPERSRVLRRILVLVQKSVPNSTRVISYGIPAFRKDRVFVYCAAFKRHIGIYPPVRGNARLVAALAPYANAKGNLSFPLDEPMPMALIARVAKALARQYAQQKRAGSKRKVRKKSARAA